MLNKSDEEIMQAVSAGDLSELPTIFTKYQTRIFNYCQRILANRSDAEDATSDVFHSVCHGRYQIRPDVKFSTWLFQVAHNASLTTIRKRKRSLSSWFSKQMNDDDFEMEMPDQQPNPKQQMDSKDQIHWVRWAIARLPLEQKEALILREYEQLKYDEIATVMNCTKDKVKVLIFRARQKIKDDLPPELKGGRI